MSRNRDERGQYTEEVTLDDVLAVFDAVDGPVVTSGDVASATGCSDDSARRKLDQLHDRGRVGRRKTAGRVVYWLLAEAAADGIDPDDAFWSAEPIDAGDETSATAVDDILYGEVE